MEGKSIKNFYNNYADHINSKRLYSGYVLRSYVHEKQYQSILTFVESGMTILDAGCGEASLSILMAEKGADVIGLDISVPNIEASKKNAEKEGLKIEFLCGDSESLPFPDDHFDLVVSSHVLEHLPDFDKGLREIMRVTKKRAVVAIPTIFNLCSLVQVGKGWFYLKGPRSFAGLIVGIMKMIYALVTFNEGVNESYGMEGIPHIFRFPWVMKRKIKKMGYKLVEYEASSICLPYFSSLLPLIIFLDKYKDKSISRNFGYGTTYVIEKC